MGGIFRIVYDILIYLSELTGLSYNEINIVVYYIIIPMIYLVMVDKILKRHIFKIGFSCLVIFTILLIDFEKFSDSLFDLSVQFLLLFNNIGWNYIVASVIICVVVPLIIFGILFYFSYWKSLRKYYLKKKIAKEE